jgi:hypothetical protein
MLNGKSYGTLLGPSFAVKIDNLVMGENTLEVEVTNLLPTGYAIMTSTGFTGRSSIRPREEECFTASTMCRSMHRTGK